MQTITLNSITGLNLPYTVYVCDVLGNNCTVLSTVVSTVPPTFTFVLPPPFDVIPAIGIKIVTSDGCERFEIYNCFVTPTPTPLPFIPPFFQVSNILGVNPLLINFRTAPNSSFNIDWGDTSTLPVNISNPPFPLPFANYQYNHNYGASVYTATCEDFKVSSSISTNNIQEINLYNISDIIENVYTFSAFSATTKIILSSTTLTDFSSSLPNSLVDFYIYNTNAPGSQNFEFTPTTNLATLPVFRELLMVVMHLYKVAIVLVLLQR